MSGKLGALGLLALGLCGVSGAAAQTYPGKPIRILVGFAPGGAVDISARVVAQKLAETIGQPVVVENRPGASGNIAAELTAKAPPDGHTLLVANVTIAMPSQFAKLAYDVTRDLAPVSLIAVGPSVLVVHPSVPVRNVKELIALARAKPKALLYGSGGVGNITHLEMELLQSMVKADMVHVPYKGAAPSIIGLLSGEVHLLFASIPSVLSQIRSGRVRALAVSTAKRNPALPDVPALSEAGVPGYDAASWYGLFAPAGVQKPVLDLLGKELVRIMALRDVRAKFEADGFRPVGSTPEEFARFLPAEIAKWAKTIKAAGIRPQ
ncbi:MAG: Bug family tripartite tricarboxylate transporter substrate binding protein [Burkholderiales bacterium]